MTDIFQLGQPPKHDPGIALSSRSQLDLFLGARGIVIIAPHPDDEILGCGALMAAVADQGQPVWVIYLTDGGASQPNLSADARVNLVHRRQSEAIAGLSELGIPNSAAIFIGAPDGSLKSSATYTKLATYKLQELIRQGCVSSVFVTCQDDDHPDHKAAYRLAVSALRDYPGVQLFAYPVSSRIDEGSPRDPSMAFPIPFNTEGFLQQKRAALACHISQLSAPYGSIGFTLSPSMIENMCEGPEYFVQVEEAFHDQSHPF
jgi:LmbE family N-acetylglucosaminyl deacetylase